LASDNDIVNFVARNYIIQQCLPVLAALFSFVKNVIACIWWCASSFFVRWYVVS